MSLERFRERYSGPDIRTLISEEKERFPQMPALAFLAMRFADFGSEELKEEEAKITDKARLYFAELGPSYRISDTEMGRVAINYSAVVFGLGLQFMDDALLWGVFDKPGFVREHNKRIAGSRIYSPLYSDAWEAQAITNNNLRKMRELANADKTLSVFFQEGYPLMPYFIQWQIGHGENLEFIKRRTLTIYYLSLIHI